MSFARDKLYKGYLRRKMPTIASTVKVREIVTHLPCLTDHDRENIEAKREMCGNHDSMVLLLDCLKRRENWPEQFIAALEACDQPSLAAEIRAEYNALRDINNSNPSSPPTTVIKAHVHPAPSASHLSIPKCAENSQASVALPAEASVPPEPAAQASPPLEIPVEPQAPQRSAAQVPEAVSPPEPVAEPPHPTPIEVALPPSTPPPSPENPHTQATTTPPPQRETNSQQEPVENSESDIQEIPDVDGVSPRSRSQIDSDVTDGSSFPMNTPEKPPVQDTAPPLAINLAAVLQPEENSESPATQVVESSPQTAATTSPLPGAAGMDASLCGDDNVCLSKPGQLISIHPQNHGSPTIPARSSPVEGPYSGDSVRLEISDAVPDAETSAHVPACSAVSSTTTASALSCQQNSIAFNHSEPEENHYESPCQSLEMQDVRVNVGQISEEPSILNLDGQSSTPQSQIYNGEAAKAITSAPPLSTSTADTVSDVINSPSENHHPSEPAPAEISSEQKTLQDSEEKNFSRTLPTDKKYILTAVGVGACALLMAWKFKN